MPRRPLGQLEAEVLSAVAADGRISTGELMSRISGPPGYTTINTILFRLHAKGLVTRFRDGRQFRYQPAVDEALLVAGRMHDQFRRGSDSTNTLKRFVELLTADEKATLHNVLDRRQAGP